MQNYEENLTFVISIDSSGNQIRVPTFAEEKVPCNCCEGDLDVGFVTFVSVYVCLVVALMYFTN